MNGYLLDTNVLSEPMRGARANRAVTQFLTQAERSFISVVSLHELTYGIARLANDKRQHLRLAAGLQRIHGDFGSAFLDIDVPVATVAADFRAAAQNNGYIVHLADALIAATAAQHSLVLATRNTADFEHLAVETFDPWTFQP